MKYLITALFWVLFTSPVLAIETDRLPVELFLSKAESYVKKGEFFKALENYQAVIDKGGNSPDTHQQMSILYYYLGFLDKAIGSSEKALKTVPNNDYLHHNLGVLYFVKNDLIKAQEHFIKALKINPGSTNSHYYLAHVFLRQNLLEPARRFAYSAKQLGHPVSDLLDFSGGELQSPPPTVWASSDSQIYLRQIFVKDRIRSEEIMNRLKEGTLFEDIARLESDSSNGGYSGGYLLDDLQTWVVSSLAAQTIPSMPIVVDSEKGFTIVQKIAPIDWQQMTSMYDIETFQVKSRKSPLGDDVDTQQMKMSSPSNSKEDLIYSVQVGAFRKYKNAQQEIEKIKVFGYEGYLVETLQSDRPLYVVYAGVYSSRSSAAIANSRLKKKGFDSLVVGHKISP